MTTFKLKEEDGKFLTDSILSKEEWLAVLHAVDNNQRRSWIDVLRMFLYQPGHKAPCSQVGKEYSVDAMSVNSRIIHFCKFAKKESGKEFRVEDPDSPTESYWPIAMYGRYLKGDLFEWELRPELISALQDFLLERLIEAYRGPVLKEGLDNSRSKELYKWRLLASTAEKSTEEILGIMASRSSEMNFITWRTQDAIKNALKEHHHEIIDCFSLLITHEGSFYEKYDKFVAFGKTFLSKTEAERILKEKEATVFIACYKPQENPVYKWSLYKDVCSFLGISTKEAKPVEGYLAILKRIIDLERQDTDLTEKLREETAPYFWSELLNAQDVLYQMQQYMQTARPKNWLQSIYDKALNTKNSSLYTWYPYYKESVELFLGMFASDKTEDSIPENTIDTYIRVQNNSVCDNGLGSISYAEYSKVRKLWPEIYAVIKRNIEADEISLDDFKYLKNYIRPALDRDLRVAYNRLWSAVFPEKLTTCCKEDQFNAMYEAIRRVDSSLAKRSGDWVHDNLKVMEYLKDKVTFAEPWHRPIFARMLFDMRNSLIEEENNHDMDKYTKILETNKNLVLTGAPGTGKTYLAKQIACQ